MRKHYFNVNNQVSPANSSRGRFLMNLPLRDSSAERFQGQSMQCGDGSQGSASRILVLSRLIFVRAEIQKGVGLPRGSTIIYVFLSNYFQWSTLAEFY